MLFVPALMLFGKYFLIGSTIPVAGYLFLRRQGYTMEDVYKGVGEEVADFADFVLDDIPAYRNLPSYKKRQRYETRRMLYGDVD